MIRFAFNLAVAYLVERYIVKLEPVSAEAMLRWHMALFAYDMKRAFRPATETLNDLHADLLSPAKGWSEVAGREWMRG